MQGASQGDDIKTLSSLEIPVEIFIIFLVQNKRNFTVNDVIEQFRERYKIELSYNRMQQILNEFCKSDKLKKEMMPAGKRKKVTAFYSFNKLM